MTTNFSASNGEFTPLIIDSIREETRNFKTFFFREVPDLFYEAGQFLTLIDRTGKQEIRRSYSMISAPLIHEQMAIGVKRMDNGFFSRKLVDRAKPGDVLMTSGVSGFFRLPENIWSFKQIFFFAAGSGITPILSLLKTALHIYPGIQINLIYSNPSVDQTAYYQDLKTLGQQFSHRLNIHFLFSTTADLRKARLNRDLLMELLKIVVFDKAHTLFYVCGPESYMRMIIFHLLEEGFPKEQIKKEDFNPGNKKSKLLLPPDKNNYDIQLKLRGTDYLLPVMYPETILQAAKKIKLNLPYSCETGKCGSCAVYCRSGKVWMARNEVLTDQELAKGLVLTCTGHPQSKNLSLELD